MLPFSHRSALFGELLDDFFKVGIPCAKAAAESSTLVICGVGGAGRAGPFCTW